jgi:hypothetical protein
MNFDISHIDMKQIKDSHDETNSSMVSCSAVRKELISRSNSYHISNKFIKRVITSYTKQLVGEEEGLNQTTGAIGNTL